MTAPDISREAVERMAAVLDQEAERYGFPPSDTSAAAMLLALRDVLDAAEAERDAAVERAAALEAEKLHAQQITAAAVAAEREACKALVTMDAVAEAMQDAWDDFCDDTGCFPDCLSLHRGKITARFGVGNFASMVTTRLRDEIDRARGEVTP